MKIVLPVFKMQRHNCGKKPFQDKKGPHRCNQHQSKPTPPPGHVYVPAKVLVPVPIVNTTPTVTKTTYVTNYVYHGASVSTEAKPPRPPVVVATPPFRAPLPNLTGFRKPKPISHPTNAISWELVTPESAVRLSDRAVVAGHEGWDGSPLWVIRARHGRDLIPGKLAMKHNVAYVPFAGKEMQVQNIEVLCAPPGHIRWTGSSNGAVPSGAVTGGHTMNGETLYIGRARHSNSVTPGKVHPSHGCCYISFSGKEVAVKDYEVLCTV